MRRERSINFIWMGFFRECFIKDDYIFNLAMKNEQTVLQLAFF